MKIGEFRDKPGDELRADLVNFRRELFNLRFQSATEQIENPSQIRETRRAIARVLTVLRERESAAGVGGKA
ncbi:MAG: 50S ribosomal protein L29 [Planctomycetes bacterium]|nr:50S ribosomal protein L29 [Planctomycetota bacterium]MBI3846663.1 50S ribosomal protein L29 [Planctomycetota bacterium]